MDENKIMKYVKDHKKHFAIAAGLTVIGGVVFAIARNPTILTWLWTNAEDLPIPAIGSGKVNELWMDKGGSVNAIVNDIPIADLGRFGEEMLKNVEQLTPDMTVDAILGFGTQKMSST